MRSSCAPVCTRFAASVHTERTQMSTMYRMPKGQWRAQVRRKGRCTMSPPAPDMQHTATGEQLSGNAPEGRPLQATRRSMKAVIRRLKDDRGGTPLADLTRERLIMNARQRARDGTGPATLAVDLAGLHPDGADPCGSDARDCGQHRGCAPGTRAPILRSLSRRVPLDAFVNKGWLALPGTSAFRLRASPRDRA